MRGLAAIFAVAAALHAHVVAPGWAVALDDRGDVAGRSFVMRNGHRRTLNGTVVAMNGRGDVVGYVGDGNTHTELWRADGTSANLGQGIPSAINDNGWVVGNDVDHGFVWHDGTRIDLGFGTTANAVNDRNVVVGAHGSQAFVWHGGVMNGLPQLGHERTEAVAVNGRGLILGDARVSSSADPDHVVVWQSGRIRSLGSFGGARSLTPVAVNDRNEVLVDTEFPDHHAWVWRDGKARDLGTLGRPWWNVAADINDSGAVVGNVQRAPHGPNVPYVWRDGKFTVLPGQPGWTHAAAINDAGVVAGSGYRGQSPVALVWR